MIYQLVNINCKLQTKQLLALVLGGGEVLVFGGWDVDFLVWFLFVCYMLDNKVNQTKSSWQTFRCLFFI